MNQSDIAKENANRLQTVHVVKFVNVGLVVRNVIRALALLDNFVKEMFVLMDVASIQTAVMIYRALKENARIPVPKANAEIKHSAVQPTIELFVFAQMDLLVNLQ